MDKRAWFHDYGRTCVDAMARIPQKITLSSSSQQTSAKLLPELNKLGFDIILQITIDNKDWIIKSCILG